MMGGGLMGGMMQDMMQQHNDMFQRMDSMMASAFSDPFFSGGRGGPRGGGGGGGARGGEMDLFGGGGMLGDMLGDVGRMGPGGSGGGVMFAQSSVMSSDGSGNTYRRHAQHKQVGDVSESNFQESDSRSQREAIGLRRGLGERSRAVTRTRHGSGDEDVQNVFNGMSEAEGAKFDSEWQSRAYGGGAARVQDRPSHSQRSQPRRQPQRQPQSALPYQAQWEREDRGARDIAPQGDIYGTVGGGGGGGGGGRAPQPRPDRFHRATPVNGGARGGSRGGGGGGGSARARPAPSHKVMAPQAD